MPRGIPIFYNTRKGIFRYMVNNKTIKAQSTCFYSRVKLINVTSSIWRGKK
jgi:hypothetical protein